MKSIFFVFSALSLCACVRITDVSEEPVPVPQAPVLKEVSPQVLASDQPNSYQVRIQVPPQAQVIHRSLKDNPESKQAVVLEVVDGILKDEHVEAGSHYIYEMGTLLDGEFTVLKTEEVQIPLDRVIDHEVVLSQDQLWNQQGRLFLGPQALITTNGFHLVIRADQLISHGGLIRTFPPGSQAALGQAGQPGGTLQISLRTGRGVLRFEFRGQRGGQGLPGQAVAMDFDFPPRSGAPMLPINDSRVFRCPQCFSGNGVGAIGGRGHDGLQGGASGRGEVRIEEEHELIVQPIFQPGQGGEGGVGGAGQLQGGRIHTPGPQGPHGSPGPSGPIENFCFHDWKGSFCW